MSGLIWVQTVCKSYQQTTLVGKEFSLLLVSYRVTMFEMASAATFGGVLRVKFLLA